MLTNNNTDKREMELQLVTKWIHCSQIATGFLMLQKNDEIKLNIQNKIGTYQGNMAIVEADYKGQHIIYDLDDGYQNQSEMEQMLEKTNFYFKRSFSSKLNEKMFPEQKSKIIPLGLNYPVAFKGNPYNNIDSFKNVIKTILGGKPFGYYTPDRFERIPQSKEDGFVIIFYTQLWEPYSSFKEINDTRIEIIRVLREKYADKFLGGLENSSLARELAPELIVSKSKTLRYIYLNKMHNADICIATSGLYNSIGWKMAEYIAAGKAIVTEQLKYEVPNGFETGKNYLEFSTSEECVQRIDYLIQNPQIINEMKIKNHEYYQKSLRPDVFVRRTLDIIDDRMNEL